MRAVGATSDKEWLAGEKKQLMDDPYHRSHRPGPSLRPPSREGPVWEPINRMGSIKAQNCETRMHPSTTWLQEAVHTLKHTSRLTATTDQTRSHVRHLSKTVKIEGEKRDVLKAQREHYKKGQRTKLVV